MTTWHISISFPDNCEEASGTQARAVVQVTSSTAGAGETVPPPCAPQRCGHGAQPVASGARRPGWIAAHVPEIKRLIAQGLGNRAIARRIGCSESSISNIRTGRGYEDTPPT